MYFLRTPRSASKNLYRGKVDTTAPVPFSRISSPGRTPKSSSLIILDIFLDYFFYVLLKEFFLIHLDGLKMIEMQGLFLTHLKKHQKEI